MANSSRATIITLNPPISPLAGGGGGIGISDSSVTVTGSKFTNNLVTMLGTDGGAVNVIFEGTLTMSGCTVTGNKGNRNGGAIHARDAEQVTCTSTTFSNNQVVGTDVGDESGAAIGSFNSNLAVTSCTFNSNVLSSGVGTGGIFFHVPFDDGNAYALSVTSSIFSNNVGKNLGGAINIFGFIPNSGVSAAITSCVFTNNTADTGGAIYIDSIPTTVTSCSFNNNRAGVNGGAIFGSNFGGSIFNLTQLTTRSKLTVTSSSFFGNQITGTASSPISPAFVLGFLAQVFSGSLGLPPASVSTIPIGGAALSSEFGGQVFVISSSFVSNNASLGKGGALLVGGSVGSSGGSPLGMNQAYLKVTSSVGYNNVDQTGSNNVALLDPTGLGPTPNGVYFLTDGSMA
jgi:predicted outer membrane repeat protein